MPATPARRAVPQHLAELARHRLAVMATLHPDGRPQLSLVQQHTHDGVIDISLTERLRVRFPSSFLMIVRFPLSIRDYVQRPSNSIR